MEGIIGISKHIESLKNQIHQIAKNDETVLITGPTGTGKELVAKNVHQLSQRNNKPYVIVDCGAIQPNLFQSELFGHVKGAFTDARENRKGKIAMANGGTLFLDEIGNLKIDNQAALLRFLNDKSYSPVGSDKVEKADIRIICATNRDLHQEKVNGTFADDLYTRLVQNTITTDHLKTRPEDIIVLLKEINPKINPREKFLLYSYDWPGNVRELENLAGKDYSYIRHYFVKETSARIGQDIPEETLLYDFSFDMALKGISADALNLLAAIDFWETNDFDSKNLFRSYEICLLKSKGFKNDAIANILQIRRSNLSKFREQFGFPLQQIELNNLYPDFIQHLLKLKYFPSQKGDNQ